MRKLIAGALIFFPLYTFFWIKFFTLPKTSIVPKQDTEQNLSLQSVLSARNISSADTGLPANYLIPLPLRQQAFNLSCEFAAASAVISYFTNDPSFSVMNERSAEEKLISQVGVSKNPNLGIRMGDVLSGDFSTLFNNLNANFGGQDYYGVHAPPFIDLFSKYQLLARPVNTNDFINSIKRAISSGHLVMTWIKIGYGKNVDVALSYGSIPIIRGEHTVVIDGYDDKGVFVMDPGTGLQRSLSYGDILSESQSFPMPFLDVYPSASKVGFEDTYGQASDKVLGLPRANLSITVENGSRQYGKGNELSLMLKDFGYKIAGLKNADSPNYEDLSIKMKNTVWDYRYLLLRDLKFASYNVATISSDLSASESADAVIVVGN